MLERCTTSKSNPKSLGCHRASFPVKSVRLRIHLMASWSVRTVKGLPSRYKRSKSTDHTIPIHSCCVVSYHYSVSVGVRDQYPIGFGPLSCCFCRRKQPAWTSHAFVPDAKCPPESAYASSGGEVRSDLRAPIVSI